MQAQTLNQLFQDAKSKVQSHPSDIRFRSVLWQVFAARGEFDRARKQLDMIQELDSSWTMEVQACHGLLVAEDLRQSVFRGQITPTCLGEPPSWFASLVAALPLLAEGRQTAALPLLKSVMAAVDARAGTVNKQPFAWLCDGDARFGPCLEVIAQGRYFWVPWSVVRSLTCRLPAEIRDCLWQHSLLEVTDGSAVEVFIPVRYPNPKDDAQRLSRITDWEALDEDLYLGWGQKTLLTDAGEVGYLDIRELRFDGGA